MFNQQEFIRKYSDENREHFNEELFVRNDDDIIRELEKVLLSCQRSRVFTLKVISFSVVDDYNEVNELLKEYEANNMNRKKAIENKFEFIPLKESDIRLLIVDWYIEVYNTNIIDEKRKILRVYIEVPRVVDKYYFRIGGNMDNSLIQIIESTYNNSSMKKSDSVGMVAYKSMFIASRFFRFDIQRSKELSLITIDNEQLKGVYFSSIIFGKSVHVMKYLLARFGIYETRRRLMAEYVLISDKLPDNPDNRFYIVNRHNLYVYAPKYIYDNDPVTQSLFYTICHEIDNKTTIDTIFSRQYWLIRLGSSFGSKTIDKGYSILESLENIPDISSTEHLRLPKEDKKDIYDIIVWILREFSALRLKDNFDVGMKRWRWAEYYALLYAYKLASGLYTISDKGSKITLRSIEKVINILPDYLIRVISKDKLVNPGNMANDLDSITALKYTYKGVSGLGEDDTSVPKGYKHVHHSHIGRVDLDSSSNSDPGMTGILCPLTDMKNGAFSDEQEPNDWREKVDEMISNYKDMYGIQQALLFKKVVGLGTQEDDKRLDGLSDTMDTMDAFLNPVSSLDKHLYGNKLFTEILWNDDRKR